MHMISTERFTIRRIVAGKPETGRPLNGTYSQRGLPLAWQRVASLKAAEPEAFIDYVVVGEDGRVISPPVQAGGTFFEPGNFYQAHFA